MMKAIRVLVVSFGVICWIAISFPLILHSQESGATTSFSLDGQSGLTSIVSDEFTLERGENQTILLTATQNAKVLQDEMSIFADKLVVYRIGNDFEKAVATGNVRLIRSDTTATGDLGTFYLPEQKLELEGQAKVWQGNNTITAPKIIAFLEQEIVEGYGTEIERVVMTVYQKEDKPLPESTPEKASQSPEQEASPPFPLRLALALALGLPSDRRRKPPP